MPGLGSADPLSDAKLLEVFVRQGVRMIVYDGEGYFTPENIPAEYLREDALVETPFSVGDWSREPGLTMLKSALLPENGCNKVFFAGDTGPDWIFSVDE